MSTARADWDDIMGTKAGIAKPSTLLGSLNPLIDEEPPATKKPEPSSYTLYVDNDASEIQCHIADTVIQIGEMLLDKNRKYGNSALDPLRVHSQATSIEQLKVRADDKLSRLRSAQADDAEDALLDYIGYMILLHIAEQKND